jgi:site-specific DNA-methyltransferase (adenine-specific)
MHNFIEAPICQGSERVGHPTQKPEVVIKRLIEIYTKEGDVILDPFVGSGTTMIVCKKLGRSSIGIEINPEYVEIAKKRLDLEQTSLEEVNHYIS